MINLPPLTFSPFVNCQSSQIRALEGHSMVAYQLEFVDFLVSFGLPQAACTTPTGWDEFTIVVQNLRNAHRYLVYDRLFFGLA